MSFSDEDMLQLLPPFEKWSSTGLWSCICDGCRVIFLLPNSHIKLHICSWKKPSYLQQITMKKFLLFYLFFICRFFNEFLLHTRCILFSTIISIFMTDRHIFIWKPVLVWILPVSSVNLWWMSTYRLRGNFSNLWCL